jgi:hypothetical protein
MSFFLLGKTPDDHLQLLSEAGFASRHDALVELSRVTASPGFDGWNLEVMVLDTDQGTPVLLVRPTTSESQAAPVPETAPEAEPATFAGIADVEATERTSQASDEALAAVMLDLGVEEAVLEDVPEEPSEVLPEQAPAVESEQAPAVESEQAPAVESEQAPEEVAGATPPEASVPEALEAVPEAPLAPVESEAPVEVVDRAWAEAVVQPPEPSAVQSGEGNLKDALKRTAARMEAEGVAAPASVGSAESTAVEPVGSQDVTEAESQEPESQEPESQETSEDGESPEATITTAWPWDAAEEPESSSADRTVQDEPGADDESMIRRSPTMKRPARSFWRIRAGRRREVRA